MPQILHLIQYLSVIVCLLLIAGPQSVREPLWASLKSFGLSQWLVPLAKWLIPFALMSKINKWLNNVAANNWLWAEEKSMIWTWSREIVVLTGGSSGIGALTAERLARKVKVVILDIQELPKHLQDYPNITFRRCDITVPEQVEEVATAIRKEFGKPSILINNAGIGFANTILESTPETLRKIFDVNVISHWHLIRTFLPDMIEAKKGHIVTIASLASFVAAPHMVNYCATKAAVLALHEGIAQELKYVYKCPQIKTSILHPGYASTPLVGAWENDLRRNGVNIMDAQVIADLIAKQIFHGNSGQIIVPGYFWFISLTRGLPIWMQMILRDKVARQHML